MAKRNEKQQRRGKGSKHAFTVALRYVILVAILLALVLWILYYQSHKKTVTYEPPVTPVVISQPQTATVQQSITLSGYVEAKAMIPVVPLVAGTVLQYPIAAGQQVKQGQVLAVIDPAPYEQQMLQAQAAYLAYQSTYERVKALYDAGATTRQNYDQVVAQRDAGLAQYELAKLQLGYATVTAPVSGTVLMAPSAVGNIASQQQPVAVIADLDELVVRLNVPEKYFSLFNEYKSSLQATVTRPQNGELSPAATANAQVVTIAPYVEAQSKVFKVELALTDNLSQFRPGMYVKVSVIYRTWPDMPTVDQVVRKVDGSVYLYDMANKTVQWVDLQPVVENEFVLAVPPELADAWFVVEGQNNVFDGQPVTVKEQL